MSCASSGNGCHPTSGNLNLDASAAYAAIVGVTAGECSSSGRKYVEPGAPAASYLIDKLLGNNTCSVNSRMPLGFSPLSAADIQMISDWICQGAENN